MKRICSIIGGCVALLVSSSALAGGDPIQGQAKSTPCAACHGAEGNSTNPIFPNLAGQQATYIVHALKEYQNGNRKNAIMAGFAGPLSDQDRKDLAAYFSSQKGLFTLKHQ